MNVKIKEFEKAAMAAVATLRDELGARRIVMEINIDKYESSCRTDVSFYTLIPAEASRVPECGGGCKGD